MVSLNQGILFLTALLLLMLCQPVHPLTRQSSNNLRATTPSKLSNQADIDESLLISDVNLLLDENDEEWNRLLQGIGTNSSDLRDILANAANLTSLDDLTEEQRRVLTQAAIIAISVAAVIFCCILAPLIACCCGCLTCCCC